MLPPPVRPSELLVLDPSRPRQLGPSGSFVLWQRRRGRDEGLLGTPISALEGGSGDHEVAVSCAVIDAFVIAVSVTDAQVLFPGGHRGEKPPTLEGPQTEALVDVASGRVSVHPPEFDDIASWLAKELDGELLSHLHTAALAEAGRDPFRRATSDELPPSFDVERVPYDALFPNARADGYHVGDRSYAALDVYEGVLMPGPSRIHVSFVDDRLVGIGTASVDLADLRLVRDPEGAATLTPEGAPLERLRTLWRLYCARHRVRPRFVRRRGRLISAMAGGA